MRKAQNQIPPAQPLFLVNLVLFDLGLTHNGAQTCNWDWICQHFRDILSKTFIVYFWENKPEVPKHHSFFFSLVGELSHILQIGNILKQDGPISKQKETTRFAGGMANTYI